MVAATRSCGGAGVALREHTIGPLPWTAEVPPILITVGNRGELLPAQFDLCVRFIEDDQQTQLERFTMEVLPALRC